MAATVSFSRLFGSDVLLWIREAFLGLVAFSGGRRTAERPLHAERSLLDQLQVRPHAIREEPFSASDDDGANDHLELVDKTGP